MFIQIHPYLPAWKDYYAHEAERISKKTTGLSFDIAHIGSTSVPDLGAKPVIDIMVGLHRFGRDAPAWVGYMQQLGYTYKWQYEEMMPYRRFFTRYDAPTLLSYNLHTVIENSDFWERHLLFRNYLRACPRVREAYYELKLNLSKRTWNDTNEYADAKTPFIRAIETEARQYFENNEKE